MRRQQHGVENWLGWVDWGGAEVGSVGCRHRENPRSQQKASRQMTFKKKCCLRGWVLFSLTCRLHFRTGPKSKPEPAAGILRACQIMCVFEASVILMPTLGWSQPKVTVHTWAIYGIFIYRRQHLVDLFSLLCIDFSKGLSSCLFLLHFLYSDYKEFCKCFSGGRNWYMTSSGQHCSKLIIILSYIPVFHVDLTPTW